MLLRDAGWAALAATLYGLCCWQLVWGAWPASNDAAKSVVANADDLRQPTRRPPAP